MTQRAIIIGVQDYAFKPLTAPAKDARDIRDALIASDIFARDEILLLIDDGKAEGVDGPASRDAILDALEPLYEQEGCHRLFVYFSGHGASWRVSSGASVLKPVLLCHGVNTFGRDGRAMIDVEELLERFRMRGPDEQIWVVDACRNIPESEGRPVVGPTTWEDKPPIQVRRRALVYAVAPLAEAAAIQGENSVFTREFLEGLAGTGRAAVYAPATDSWIVTHRSICEYAQARLETGMAEWEKAFKLPRVEFESDPPPSALRTLPEDKAPRPRAISLKVDPAAAAMVVSARLKREGGTPAQWPPHNASMPLPPAVYRFEAELALDAGWERLTPATALIDTRETDEITVRVSRPEYVRNMITGVDSDSPQAPEPVGVQGGLVETGRRKKRGKKAKVRIETAELKVQFSATLLGAATMPMELVSSPIWVKPNIWRIDAELPPGLWRIDARLAEEPLGSIDIDLEAGSVVDLRLIAGMPKALRAAMGRKAVETAVSRPAPALTIAERMGPIQGAVLPSVLPLLALKAFDQSVLPLVQTPWLPSMPTKPGDAPVSVAVALDGDWGNLPAPEVGSISLHIAGEKLQRAPTFNDGFGLAVLADPIGPPEAEAVRDRIPDSNLATLRVPGWGRLEFALPRIPNRVACIGAILRAGGQFELSIASLAARPDNLSFHSRSETARAVAIGARLLGTGTSDRQTIKDAAYGKWMDPMLGALAWHAIGEHDAGHPPAGRTTIARNMFAAFPSLADSLLLVHWLSRRQEMNSLVESPAMARHVEALILESLIQAAPVDSVESLLERLHETWQRRLPFEAREPARRIWRPWRLNSVFSQQPVLAASVDALADLADEAGASGHWAVRRRALIQPGAVWNVVFSRDAGGKNG